MDRFIPTKEDPRTTAILKRELHKAIVHWKLYLFCVLFFIALPAIIKTVYYTYGDLEPLVANVQPFEVTKDVVQVGDFNSYIIDAKKRYQFPGRGTRELWSEDCNVSVPVDVIESNKVIGDIKITSPIHIPPRTTPDCTYIVRVEVAYTVLPWRTLDPITFVSEPFLVVRTLPPEIEQLIEKQAEERIEEVLQ